MKRKTGHSEDMPIPLGFLRGVLAVLCLFFAYMAGRSAGAVDRDGRNKRRVYGWIIRSTLCGGALLFRHSLDTVALITYVLAAAAVGVGWWDERRPRKQEDLTQEMFPPDDNRT